MYEEADTKVFACINYVDQSGFGKAVIYTIDTDTVVLGLHYQAFTDCGIFIHLRCVSKKWLLELQNTELPRQLCVTLPGLHVLTQGVS